MTHSYSYPPKHTQTLFPQLQFWKYAPVADVVEGAATVNLTRGIVAGLASLRTSLLGGAALDLGFGYSAITEMFASGSVSVCSCYLSTLSPSLFANCICSVFANRPRLKAGGGSARSMLLNVTGASDYAAYFVSPALSGNRVS